MKYLVLKLAGDAPAPPDPELAEAVTQTVPPPLRPQVTVKRLFPTATQGRRSRLYQVELPDEAPLPDVLASLRDDARFEYVDEPQGRRPL